MTEYHPDLKKLRGYWQFANICQFFLTFGDAYGMDDFDSEEFEGSFIRQDREALGQIMLKLIKNLDTGRFSNINTWEQALRKELDNITHELPILKDFETGFFDLTLFQQVVIMQFLTDLQFRDSPDKIRAAGIEDECLDWRVDPIGEDKRGNIYWLFDDNRMFIQKLAPRPPKSNNVKQIKRLQEEKLLALEKGESIDTTWEPVCLTLEDWETFPDQFKNSRNLDEKDLYEILIEDVIPKVIPEFKAKIRQMRKKVELASLIPKRSSRLQQKEFQRMEQEQLDRKRELFHAIDEEPSSNLIRSHHSINTREMRAKRRELRTKGDLDELKQLEKDSIKKSFDSVQDEEEDVDIETHSTNEDDFYFDCICGLNGKNFDDGSEQVCCEKCGVWQHILCQNFTDKNGDPIKFEDLDFYCNKCQNEDESNNNKVPGSPIKIKIRLGQQRTQKDMNGSEDVNIEANELVHIKAHTEMNGSGSYDVIVEHDNEMLAQLSSDQVKIDSITEATTNGNQATVLSTSNVNPSIFSVPTEKIGLDAKPLNGQKLSDINIRSDQTDSETNLIPLQDQLIPNIDSTNSDHFSANDQTTLQNLSLSKTLENSAQSNIQSNATCSAFVEGNHTETEHIDITNDKEPVVLEVMANRGSKRSMEPEDDENRQKADQLSPIQKKSRGEELV